MSINGVWTCRQWRISLSLSCIHRVFISNLQKEIEKQTGYRSSRQRRSAPQYDYEVYHSLEEVDVKSAHSLTHAQSKRTSAKGALKIPITPLTCFFSRMLVRSPTRFHTLHSFKCLFSQDGQVVSGHEAVRSLWSSWACRHSTHRAPQVFINLSSDLPPALSNPLVVISLHRCTHVDELKQGMKYTNLHFDWSVDPELDVWDEQNPLWSGWHVLHREVVWRTPAVHPSGERYTACGDTTSYRCMRAYWW